VDRRAKNGSPPRLVVISRTRSPHAQVRFGSQSNMRVFWLPRVGRWKFLGLSLYHPSHSLKESLVPTVVMIKFMTTLHSTDEQVLVSSDSRPESTPSLDQPYFSLPTLALKVPWNFTTYGALLMLVVLWALKVYTTWGAWGNLTIDSGHEMYIPALLAEGKMLYRDVWFMYGPAAPYFTSYLFRLFGVHLNVLYWAGSLSALGSATFLYLAGMRLSSWLVGWTAGAVVLMEAFQPSLFCFPLPYASAAVYACLIGCLFLWLVTCASTSTAWPWTFAAGIAAAVALLLKPEFGIACYSTLALLIALRSFFQRSWRLLVRDVAAILPGIAICGFVIRWMVSIAGVEFITQENVVSWPTSYFMKTYGKMWLAENGFTITGSAFHEAMFRAIPVAVVVLVSCSLLWWKRFDTRAILLKTMFILAGFLYFVKNNYFILSFSPSLRLMLSTIFFPRDMVLYIIVAAVVAWWYFWHQNSSAAVRSPAIPLLLTFSSLLAFRILMKMVPGGYPIYYNGPVVLSFLLLMCLIVRRSGRSRRFVFLGELVICLACLTPVVLHARTFEAQTKDFVPLATERGTVRASKHLAENYKAAIQFMKEKSAAGQSVLLVPEDTSLYFLSGTYCPTRVFSFTPGVLAPGKMTDDMIREIAQKPVSYLLWSNRTFPEYGVPVFGEDFDREIGDYLKSHYRPIGPLTPNTGDNWEWTAVVWERKPEAAVR
jgi:hypothetical protein